MVSVSSLFIWESSAIEIDHTKVGFGTAGAFESVIRSFTIRTIFAAESVSSELNYCYIPIHECCNLGESKYPLDSFFNKRIVQFDEFFKII